MTPPPPAPTPTYKVYGSACSFAFLLIEMLYTNPTITHPPPPIPPIHHVRALMWWSYFLLFVVRIYPPSSVTTFPLWRLRLRKCCRPWLFHLRPPLFDWCLHVPPEEANKVRSDTRGIYVVGPWNQGEKLFPRQARAVGGRGGGGGRVQTI